MYFYFVEEITVVEGFLVNFVLRNYIKILKYFSKISKISQGL